MRPAEIAIRVWAINDGTCKYTNGVEEFDEAGRELVTNEQYHTYLYLLEHVIVMNFVKKGRRIIAMLDHIRSV